MTPVTSVETSHARPHRSRTLQLRTANISLQLDLTVLGNASSLTDRTAVHLITHYNHTAEPCFYGYD